MTPDEEREVRAKENNASSSAIIIAKFLQSSENSSNFKRISFNLEDSEVAWV